MDRSPHAREEKAEQHNVPEGELIYRAIRQSGDHALEMPLPTLAWSGLAAGLSMGFSFLAEGLLHAGLPAEPWRPLISKFGYAMGFLIVVLGRQQLFTEQTLSAVLPLLSSDRPRAVAPRVARMWVVVLVANLMGTACYAATIAWTAALEPPQHAALTEVASEALRGSFLQTYVGAVFAGFLIATMVWMLPGAAGGRLWIVVFVTYVVGLGGFAHAIAGSVEGWYAVFRGASPLGNFLFTYLPATVLGNATGGMVLVGALAHVQHAPEESR